MANYYLDIETTGLNPKEDKIITIQFMKLDSTTSKPTGDLVILKEWESSEKNIIKEFLNQSRITGDDEFSFVSVGYNLGFDHSFIMEKARINGLEMVDILKRPFIDLRPFGVIMNNGQFKGSGLGEIAGKMHDGKMVPVWYAEKRYDKIIEYIEDESKKFVRLASWLYKELPPLLHKFKKEKDIE